MVQKAVVFADYRGTTVKKIDELRRSLSKENISTKVAKITLIRLALTARGIDATMLDPKAQSQWLSRKMTKLRQPEFWQSSQR